MYWNRWSRYPKSYTEQEVADQVIRSVDSMWSSIRGHEEIVDDESQSHFIRAKRRKYRFPDYLGLVGSPSPEDYESPGKLTLVRKAQLLLLGTFNWQGLILGTHQSVFGRDCFGEPAWRNDAKGWYVAMEPVEPPFTYDGFFHPMQGIKCQPLSHFLFKQSHELSTEQGILHRNTNPYDCHPDNLATYSKKGRPMRCLGCQQRVHPRDSERFKIGSSYRRYCFRCLRSMEGVVALRNRE